MDFSNLSKENVMLYAIKSYNSPNMIMKEFASDYRRINFVRSLFRKYITTGIIKERLVLNHLIVLYNVFGVEAATRLLFQRMEKEYYSQLKTFVVYLCCMPDIVFGINGMNIISSDIVMDEYIIKILRELK